MATIAPPAEVLEGILYAVRMSLGGHAARARGTGEWNGHARRPLLRKEHLGEAMSPPVVIAHVT